MSGFDVTERLRPAGDPAGAAPAQADCAPYPFGCGGVGTVVDGTCRRCGAPQTVVPSSGTPEPGPTEARPSAVRSPQAVPADAEGRTDDGTVEGVVCAPPERREGAAAFGAVDVALHVCHLLLMLPVRLALFILLLIPRSLRVLAPAAFRFGSANGMGLGLFTSSVGGSAVPETLVRVRLADGGECVMLLRGAIRGGSFTLGHAVRATGRMGRDGVFRTRRVYDRVNRVWIRAVTPGPLLWNRMAMVGLIALYLAIAMSVAGGLGLLG
ncbi:hypothetical protein [Bifidobacterium saguinibicoloris]|uniref:hypothetical protein n=1 Tax=Bifidobacterium saguinibicoloris TaxID=2834433 RepID=UPI001C585193|nr:hypothetical protein [Bifidobacterium saguinibicoloris]MBW3080203.1 hypothetical protein [Bifidobacterium saguinibicoloris]